MRETIARIIAYIGLKPDLTGAKLRPDCRSLLKGSFKQCNSFFHNKLIYFFSPRKMNMIPRISRTVKEEGKKNKKKT